MNSSVSAFCLGVSLLLCVRKTCYVSCPREYGFMKNRPYIVQGLELQEVSLLYAACTLLLCYGCSVPRSVFCRVSPCLQWGVFKLWPEDVGFNEVCSCLLFKRDPMRGAWVAQSVKHLTSAQVRISQFVSSGPASGSMLTSQSLEPASDSVPPFSLPLLHSCSLFLKNKR